MSSLRFRPRLDSLDGRLVPSGNPGDPPNQPPADPGPQQADLSVDIGVPVYFADGSGTVTRVVTINSDGTKQIVEADPASQTGWTAVTITDTNVSAAAAPPPAVPNPIPPFGAAGGGAVTVPPNGKVGRIDIGGGQNNGGYTIFYGPGVDGGINVKIVWDGGASYLFISPDGSIYKQPGQPPVYYPPTAN